MSETPKTVLAHGVFDVLHHGHIQHLQEARKLAGPGGRLVVNIVADGYVDKGPGRPVFNQEQRALVLSALEIVDHVQITAHKSAIPYIHELKPDIYTKGIDYKSADIAGNLDEERAAVEAHGGTVVLTESPKDSSSRVSNSKWPNVPQEAADWVKRSEFKWEMVKHWLDLAAGQRFITLGETIFDLYTYVTPAGKSPKENYTNWTPTSTEDPGSLSDESWKGGISVISDHLERVSEVVRVGVRGGNVIKHRYVQQDFMNKVFSLATGTPVHEIIWGDRHHGDFVIGDFGHTIFDQDTIDETQKRADWLAATIQTNGLNFGMNRMGKWGRIDYITCDLIELELANPAAIREGIDTAAQVLMATHSAEAVAVTMGHNGAKLFMYDQAIVIPAFNANAADRIGAGDAWLGWTAPLVKVGAPIDVIAFVGACAAAVHVDTVGNKAASAVPVHNFMKGVLA